jgi:hypothetical protein
VTGLYLPLLCLLPLPASARTPAAPAVPDPYRTYRAKRVVDL